jgi:hypothetical protein
LLLACSSFSTSQGERPYSFSSITTSCTCRNSWEIKQEARRILKRTSFLVCNGDLVFFPVPMDSSIGSSTTVVNRRRGRRRSSVPSVRIEEWAKRPWAGAFSRPCQVLGWLDHLWTRPKRVSLLVGLVGQKAIITRAKLG